LGKGLMATELEKHIAALGLVQTEDPENEKPLYRRTGFEEMSTFEELDLKVGHALRDCRREKGLSRADVATLVGLSEQVYGRYERNASKLHVSRLIHLSEVLSASPLDMLYAAAPHLWGASKEEAEMRFRMMQQLEDLPPDTIKSIAALLEKLSDLHRVAGDAKENDA
jgi:transcriptional regulator with XRE-family HTH domain